MVNIALMPLAMLKGKKKTSKRVGNINSLQKANTVKPIYDLNYGRKGLDVPLNCLNTIELYHIFQLWTMQIQFISNCR